MYEEDGGVEDSERSVLCPYDSNHRVAAARIANHLAKCRKNFFVNEDEDEKTKCPFNPDHLIFAQEMECHEMLCSERTEASMGKDLDVEVKVKEVEGEERQGNEAVEMKSHLTCDSRLRTDETTEETGYMSGIKVGGMNEISVSENSDEESEKSNENREIVANGEIRPVKENRAKDEPKCDDSADRSESAVSHMAGSEPQDHNIPIEKQLSQTNGSLTLSEDEPESTESSTDDGSQHENEEHFDYAKYAPTKEEKEEFLKLISQHKAEQSNQGEKYDAVTNQTYSTQPWPQGYTYITQSFQTVPPFQNPNMATSYIAVHNGYPVMTSIPQSAYPPYTFQPTNGPAGYIQAPVQNVGYEYGPVFPNRQFRPPYRRRGYHNNNMHNNNNRHNNYNNGNNHSHYNGHNNYHPNNNNNNRHYNNGYHHHHSNNNGFYYTSSNDSHSHADTDSNSSGQSDVSLGEEALCNGNSHHTRRPPRNSRRVFPPRNPINLVKVGNASNIIMEKIVQIMCDTDDESPASLNGDISGSDISPEPSETFDIDDKKKTEREKLGRKLKKKLVEITGLEKKKDTGEKLDCDQLKKLSRKQDLEDELAALNLD